MLVLITEGDTDIPNSSKRGILLGQAGTQDFPYCTIICACVFFICKCGEESTVSHWWENSELFSFVVYFFVLSFRCYGLLD